MPERVPCLLVSVDGMRPDGLMEADAPFLKQRMQEGAFTLSSQTVMPSVTLPCHTSMFFGVDPERHGITTNTWTPQVRPVVGIVESLHRAGLRSAFFTNWEPLRDLAPPEKLAASLFFNTAEDEGGTGDVELAEAAARRLTSHPVDFAFLYLGYTDTSGHRYGWMSEPYLRAIANADRCIASVCGALGAGWNIIVTSDHGGHGKSHGTTMPEDINTPIVLWGPAFKGTGRIERQAHITDIAPTILDLFGAPAPAEWIGTSLRSPLSP